MPRRDRIVVPSLPHHITHRGNRRDEIFRQADDYRIYLRLLRKAVERNPVKIWAYVLMPNHIHLIVVPEREDSLADAIQWAHGKYADVFNGLYGTVGHLWQGRFRSTVMDESHLFNGVRYVERNPVRAGLVGKAEDYSWSSAAVHCGFRSDPLVSGDLPFANVIQDWSGWLAGAETEEEIRRLRNCTQTGYPCGPDEFVRCLEQRVGHRIFSRNGSRGVKGDEGSDPSSPPSPPLFPSVC